MTKRAASVVGWMIVTWALTGCAERDRGAGLGFAPKLPGAPTGEDTPAAPVAPGVGIPGGPLPASDAGAPDDQTASGADAEAGPLADASLDGPPDLSLADGGARSPRPGPQAGSSCAGHCGGQAPDGCHCDGDCSYYGDCCADLTVHCGGGPTPGASDSCVGNCGFDAPDGCFCDEDCDLFGDCCADKVTACGP